MMTILVIIGVGAVVGLLVGLVGIGGGVLMVPFLYFFYDRPDLFGVVVSEEARVVLAHGTSLLVIVPTSVRGVLAFHKARLVEWSAVWPVGIAAIVAALVGARLAAALPPEALRTGFGVLLIVSGARMLLPNRGPRIVTEPERPRRSRFLAVITGTMVGLFSALMGVGGGTLAIPFLIYVHHIDIRKVAATSVGIIGMTATAGTIGYMVSGFGQPGLPSGTFGYVHVTVALAMIVGALLSVKWGTSLNQTLKPRTLTLLFGGFFLLLGVRLAGANLLALLGRAGSNLGMGPFG